MTMAATTTMAQPFNMQLSIFLSHSVAGTLCGIHSAPYVALVVADACPQPSL
ncbi:hypothetical protein [Prevotella melaninogenica]|uniref:hypothetical protein n=1 Tax=Prevotella melaninogenica TaxID=28132 RepID=UPI00288BFA20|nr:hypothetical protein [uncultured Prevotella sp.]